MREFRLFRSSIPGTADEHHWLTMPKEVPDRPVMQPTIDCQILEGFAINQETGKPDENEPRVIVYLKNMDSTEIPTALREQARHFILQAGDPLSDFPLIAPEQEAVVCFRDERNGDYFWT